MNDSQMPTMGHLSCKIDSSLKLRKMKAQGVLLQKGGKYVVNINKYIMPGLPYNFFSNASWIIPFLTMATMFQIL